MNSRSLKYSRGVALAYVVGALAVLGILVGLGWRMIRANDVLVALDRWDAEARLLAASGLDYALSQIGSAGSDQNLSYATDSLAYNLEDQNLSFDLKVRSYGLFGRAVSTGKTRLPREGRSKTKTALLGQRLDLSRLPTLGLLNREGNMVLAGHAEVSGPVLLWKGDVRKATDIKVRWSGSKGHTGETWDSTVKIWDRIKPDFARAEDWFKRQEAMLSAHSFDGDGDFDAGTTQNSFLPDSGVLTDTVMSNCRIMGGRLLRISDGVRLRDCKLLAENIVIKGNARLERVLAFAGQNLVVQGEAQLIGGQYVARDTVALDLATPFQAMPVFYAQGRRPHRGRPDSSYVGALILKKAQGEGLFLSAMTDRLLEDHAIRLLVLPGARVSGLMFTSGLVRMEGHLQGSLICHNLKFEYDGTIWMGHLKDARITAFTEKKEVAAPLLFPGWPPMAIPVALRMP